MLPRWPLLYRVVFEARKMLARGTNAERSGLNEGGHQLMGTAPEPKVKSTAAQILGASSAVLGF